MSDENDNNLDKDTVTISRVQKPKMHKVLMHNDDYTTMEFVVHVLTKFFRKTPAQAQEIMMTIHTKGMAVCGIFTYEVAEAKAQKVMRYARKEGHPLKCSTEPCQ